MSEIQFLVSASWLREQLENPKIVIIDCRSLLSNPEWGEQQYQKSHIQGAYYLDLNRDLSAPVQRHGGRHPLPDPNVLADKLANMGVVKGETTVVAYDDSRFAFAARLWWLLRYLGHDRVCLLDGGWNGWQKNGYPVTDSIPPKRKGSFLPMPRLDWIVDLDSLKSLKDLPEVVLIDSRERDRYFGYTEPIDPIAGHIPGAINSPWKEVTNSEGYFQSFDAQKKLWADYQNSREILVYCGSGVTACVNFFSLTLTGFSNVKLYPGGWSDWCSYLI